MIGYGLSKDLMALGLYHPEAMQKDLIKCRKFHTSSSGQARKLQDVSRRFLGREIQGGKHSARQAQLICLLIQCGFASVVQVTIVCTLSF